MKKIRKINKFSVVNSNENKKGLFVFKLFYVDGVFDIIYLPQKREEKLAKCNKMKTEKYIFFVNSLVS